MAIIMTREYMPVELKFDNDETVVVQVNMAFLLDCLMRLWVAEYYTDADYYGMRFYIDAYTNMDNAPMPSSIQFQSPLHGGFVHFPMWCYEVSEMYRTDDDDTISLDGSIGSFNVIEDDGDSELMNFEISMLI